MADDSNVVSDVMTTPEQVLAAGGVSKRRRGASRRSPSGQRCRAPTPEPPKDLSLDADEELELKFEISPTKPQTISTTEKTLVKKRSHSSPGENRQTLTSSISGPTELKQEFPLQKSEDQTVNTGDMSQSRTVVVKRKSTTEKTLVTKRSLSSPGEGRQSLPQSTTTDDLNQQPDVPRRRRLSDEGDKMIGDETSVRVVKKSATNSQLPVKAEEIVKSKTTVKEEKPVESVKTVKVEEAVKIKKLRKQYGYLFLKEMWQEWKKFVAQHSEQWRKIISQRNRCIGALLVMIIYCGIGGLIFRFTEGAFEAFYKCGVKRVKRDFVDTLWYGSHNMLEEEWKSQARKKLMELENQLHAAHEAGVTSYSGQRAWSFLNAVVYCLTVVTTIGYGHIAPSTTTGRAITIIYAIFGIPMFLILLADFGKLFTRGIKFVWAFVRRVYYTGSCKKVRRTVPVQEVMKGVQLVYDFATFRRPSQMMGESGEDGNKQNQSQPPTSLPLDGHEPQPGTPALSTFEVDDEFNLPISVAIVILLMYIFVGATVYWTWENWGFFESFYFVFISMSTIGFGDFVPQHPMYMMASIVYLVFGLALTSMCINVVQEKLSDSFRQASAKIGATIGLRINEEDGAITPVPPPHIELPEVHNTVTKDSTKNSENRLYLTTKRNIYTKKRGGAAFSKCVFLTLWKHYFRSLK
ncbi:hypothetical protein L9F63_018382, partial [Diploptera punctata]